MSWVTMQSVNFYLEEFQPSRLPASLRRRLKRLSVVVLLIGCLMAALLAYEVYLQRQVDQLTLANQALEQSIQQQTLRLNPIPVKPGLKKKIEQAGDELMLSRQRLAWLDSRPFSEPSSSQSSSVSYYSMLTQLGNLAGGGVWLQEIQLNDGVERIRLQGLARRAADIPSYLERLQHQSGFEGRTFAQLNLERGNQGIAFVLDSEAIREKQPRSSQSQAQSQTMVTRQRVIEEVKRLR